MLQINIAAQPLALVCLGAILLFLGVLGVGLHDVSAGAGRPPHHHVHGEVTRPQPELWPPHAR